MSADFLENSPYIFPYCCYRDITAVVDTSPVVRETLEISTILRNNLILWLEHSFAVR